MTGAATPIRLLTRLTRPPIVAVPPRGLISDTIEEATGAAADTPDSAMVIQASAQTGLVVNVAPNTARPASMPATIESRQRPVSETRMIAPSARVASRVRSTSAVAKCDSRTCA